MLAKLIAGIIGTLFLLVSIPLALLFIGALIITVTIIGIICLIPILTIAFIVGFLSELNRHHEH